MRCTWASSFRDYETIVLIMSRSISPPAQGRTGQKARTRAAMIEAARTLLAAGTTPTVEAAAAHAGVSRATAYRYFVNQRALLVATPPMLDTASPLPPHPPPDPTDRGLLLARPVIELSLASAAGFRFYP